MAIDKKKIIIFTSIALLIILVFLCWGLFKAKNLTENRENLKPGKIQGEEVFSLTGKVAEVNVKESFLLVLPTNYEFYVKVFIPENAIVEKAKILIGTSTASREEKNDSLKISDFKVGNKVFIKAKENIAGKSEISNISLMQILP
jgi:hypothetical protein